VIGIIDPKGLPFFSGHPTSLSYSEHSTSRGFSTILPSFSPSQSLSHRTTTTSTQQKERKEKKKKEKNCL
jgi:hypothetical protein